MWELKTDQKVALTDTSWVKVKKSVNFKYPNDQPSITTPTIYIYIYISFSTHTHTHTNIWIYIYIYIFIYV